MLGGTLTWQTPQPLASVSLDGPFAGLAVPKDVTVNQITWQVSSLREVVGGNAWLKDRIRVVRTGRDMPGSNWHFYPVDPCGHTNELYYGIEQIGPHHAYFINHQQLQLADYLAPVTLHFQFANQVLTSFGSGNERGEGQLEE